MNDTPRHLLDTFTDSDWHEIVVGLRQNGSARSVEMADLLVGWRIEVNRLRVLFLQVFHVLG